MGQEGVTMLDHPQQPSCTNHVVDDLETSYTWPALVIVGVNGDPKSAQHDLSFARNGSSWPSDSTLLQ